MAEDNMQDPAMQEDDETVVPPVHSEEGDAAGTSMEGEGAPEGAHASEEDENEAGDAA